MDRWIEPQAYYPDLCCLFAENAQREGDCASRTAPLGKARALLHGLGPVGRVSAIAGRVIDSDLYFLLIGAIAAADVGFALMLWRAF